MARGDKAQAHLEASPLEHWQLDLEPLEPDLEPLQPLEPLEAFQPLEASRAPRVFDSWQGIVKTCVEKAQNTIECVFIKKKWKWRFKKKQSRNTESY